MRKLSKMQVTYWLPWPEESLSVDYNSTSAVIGNGEARLVKMLGGAIQGGSVSYDIIDKMGNKWEVKEPVQVLVNGTGGKFRSGTEGASAIVVSRTMLEASMSEIVSGFEKLKSLNELDKLFLQDEINLIAQFIEKDVPMAKKGEFSKGRIETLHKVLKAIGNATKSVCRNQKFIVLGDETISIHRIIDSNLYVKVGKLLGLTNDELRINAAELSASLFDSFAFQDPDQFIKKYWESAIKASDVFGHTDGIILVRPDSYRIVPRDKLDSTFAFNNITQGKPSFKIVS